eukprot:5636239-Pyramimonas_sp.AAC.2
MSKLIAERVPQARQLQLEGTILEDEKTGTAATVAALSTDRAELATEIRETESRLSVEDAELSAFERALKELKSDLLEADGRKQIAMSVLTAAITKRLELEEELETQQEVASDVEDPQSRYLSNEYNDRDEGTHLLCRTDPASCKRASQNPYCETIWYSLPRHSSKDVPVVKAIQSQSAQQFPVVKAIQSQSAQQL